MELKCLKTRLLEIITDLNCEELKHTPDSIAATHHALHHLQKLFSESLTEFDWQYAMSFARFIFEKVSGRILICAAYEIKFDEKTLLPWGKL
jgi:hypothetical protein